MRASLHTLLHVVAATGAAAGAALPWPAQAQAQTQGVSAASTYFVEAIVNGRDTELIVQVDRDARGFVISADELAAIGVRVDNLPLDADRRIALAEVPGLKFRYIEDEQRMELTLPDSQLIAERIGFINPQPPVPTSGTGVLLNYAAHLQNDRVQFEQKQIAKRLHAPLLGSARYGRLPPIGEEEFQAHYERRNRTFALSSELRVFSPRGVFVNSGYSTLENGKSEYTRQDTYWTTSNVDHLRTYTVGDFISSSLTWSRAVRLGGISIARNFDVRPDLVTFPVPALGGSAVVPTTVDLYINGLRQTTAQASGGPFLFASPPALSGAGMASIVFQDALGREVVLQRPLYMDTRMLAAGNTDYALQLGYPRRNYGSRSFDYRDALAASASYRRGLRDGLTLEAHGEATDGVHNLGVGGLVGLGRFGVFDAAVSVSGGDTSGQQLSLGYQYLSPRFSVDIRGLRTNEGFRDIGTLDGALIPERQLHASLSVPITSRHSVMLTYTRQQASITGGSRIVTLGYSGSFGRRLNVFANVFRDMDLDDPGGVYIGAMLTFDNRIGALASVSRYGEHRTASMSVSRAMDYDRGGFGWNVAVDGGNDDYRHAFGRLDYRGDRIEASLQSEHAVHDQFRYDNQSLFATGALVFMAGDLMASRYVYDAFAVVSTGGVGGVPVRRENRLAGTTNRNGHLVVPDLFAYQTNQIMLDTLDLPLDIGIEQDRVTITPQAQSGVLADFPVDRYDGATVILVDERSQVLPVGAIATLVDSGETYVVGYDGQVFFPTLQADNRITVRLQNGACEATFAFAPADAMHTLGPVTCRSTAP